YLQNAKDPAGKAKVLLTLGAVKISAHKPDEAQKIAEEIMALQPEGRVNAEARLLAGEVQLERGNFDDAGKAFKGVALLYDDPAITPRALNKAALAYRQAGNAEEAVRLSRELRERYPNYAGGELGFCFPHSKKKTRQNLQLSANFFTQINPNP